MFMAVSFNVYVKSAIGLGRMNDLSGSIMKILKFRIFDAYMVLVTGYLS